LGTGELDAGPGISFGKRISSEWRMFTDLYYIFIGSPSGMDLRDQTTFDFGASYDFAEDLTGSVAYEESRSVIKGKNNPEDLAFGIKYKLNDTTRIFGGIAFGLSDTAADISMSVGGGIKF
jgi:long-subunit fatty acid transport protein